MRTSSRAFRGFQKEARHCQAPGNLVRRRSLHLATAITPEGDILGQQAPQAGHPPGVHCLQNTGEQLLLGVANRWSALYHLIHSADVVN